MGFGPRETSGWSLGSEGWVRTSDFQGFSSRDYFKDSSFSTRTFVEGLFSADPSFSEKLGERFLQELHSLGKERDAVMFFEGLFTLGGRLEAAGKIETALHLYSALVDLGAKAPPYEISVARGFSPVFLFAQQRLDALQGRGTFGGRAEVLIGNLSEKATDYRLILPMVAGTMASQVVKTATLTRLALSPQATWLSRGFRARAVSSLTATAIEIPTFLFLNRGLRELGGEKVAWDAGSIGQDWITTGITLGTLKLSSWVASTVPRAQHFSQPFSTFFGLLGAHHIEVTLGLRPQVDGATTWTDTLGNWVGLGVGAHLAQGILGSQWRKFQSELATLPERVSLNKSLNPSWAYSPTPAVSLPALPQHMLAMSRPKVGKPGETGSTAPVRGKAGLLAPLVGTSLPMMSLLGLFGRKKPAPKALPEPQNEAESRAIIPFQYDHPEYRLTLRERLEAVKKSKGRLILLGGVAIGVGEIVQMIGGGPYPFLGVGLSLLYSWGLVIRDQIKYLYIEKGSRAQQIRIKKALNALPQYPPVEKPWDLADYLALQRTAQQQNGLSLELLTARILKRAEPERLERMLGQIFGERHGEILFFIRKAKLKSGERLFLDALAQKGLRPEVYSWLIEGLGEIGSEAALPLLRNWVQGEIRGAKKELRIAAALAIVKITRDSREIPVLRNLTVPRLLYSISTTKRFFWAMSEALLVSGAGKLEVDGFLKSYSKYIEPYADPFINNFINPLLINSTMIQLMARSGDPTYVSTLLHQAIGPDKPDPSHRSLEICEALLKAGHFGGMLKHLSPHIFHLKTKVEDQPFEGNHLTPADIRWATVFLIYETSAQEPPVKIFRRDYSNMRPSGKGVSDSSLWEWILDNAAANPDLPASTRMALARSFHELGRRYGSGLLERAKKQAEKLLTDPEFSLEAGELMDQLDPGWDARFLGYTGKELPEPSK